MQRKKGLGIVSLVHLRETTTNAISEHVQLYLLDFGLFAVLH